MVRIDLPPDIQEILKKPMAAEAIGPHPRHSNLSSIKPAFVIERLIEAFGVGGWNDEVEEIEHHLEERVYKRGTPQQYSEKVWVATVKLTFIVEKFGLRKQQYGGSDNTDLGDAFKGARTDCLTKIASELGVALDVYKGHGGAAKEDTRPACPQCGKKLFFSKKADDPQPYYCWTKKEGCGATFSQEGLKAALASKNGAGKSAPPAKAPQSAQQPRPQSAPPMKAGKFSLKGIVTDRRMERKGADNIFWLTVDGRECATKQPVVMNELAKAFKGASVEMLVTKLSGEKGDIYQIREVIRVAPPQQGGRQ